MAYPATYRYTKEHEWIEVAGKTGKVGITDYAQNTLGDIVFVDLPKPGSKVEKGKVFGSVESVKAVSDLYSPVTGTVLRSQRGAGNGSGKDQCRRPRGVDAQSGDRRSCGSGPAARCGGLREVRQRRNPLKR